MDPCTSNPDSIDTLKRAVFSAVRDRGVKLIVVDEAMNLVMKERGGQTLRSRLDVAPGYQRRGGLRIPARFYAAYPGTA